MARHGLNQGQSLSLSDWIKRIKKIARNGLICFVTLFILIMIIGECDDKKQLKEAKANPYVYLDNRNETPKDSIEITWPESIGFKTEVDFVRSFFGDMRKVEDTNGKTFYISSKPINEKFWDFVMDNEYPGLEERPTKTGVSWNECDTFCKRLNEMLGTTFSLPSEEEWKQAVNNKDAINYNPLTDKQEFCMDWAKDADGKQLPQKVICGFDVVEGEASSNLLFKESSIAPTEKPTGITFRLVLRGK